MKKFTLFLSTLLFSMMSFGAPLGEGYSKVTDITTLSAGDKVVLYCDDASLGITGWDGNKTATAATTGWVEYVVEAAEGGVLLKDTDKYIALTAKNAFYYNETGSVCKVNATGVLYITFNGADYLLYENANNGNPLYRMYVDKTGNAQYKPFYVYLVGEGGNTTPDDGGETPEVTADTITCAEAATIAAAENYVGTDTVTVVGYVTELGNAKEDGSKQCFYMADTKDGGKVFMAYWAFVSKLYVVGDKVAVTGILENYNGTIEIVDGQSALLEAAAGETPDDDQDGEGLWLLVTDASDLAAGDQIVVAASGTNVALSTNQKSNNRGQVDVTKNGNSLVINDDVQVITLEVGTKTGTYAFNVGNGYLYAASSSSNHLKTETTLSDNSSWAITITDEGVASVVAQGENTRNVMQYNETSTLFACYSSASQKPIALYKKTNSEGVVLAPAISGETNFLENTTVTITAEEGLEVYYTLDGTDPTKASTKYTAPFELTATTTVKAIAYNGDKASAVAEKTFSKMTILTCAEAVALCTNSATPGQHIIHGYVTEMIEAYNDQYKNITFWMADTPDGGQVLQAFRVKPVSDVEQSLKVGDFVEVIGSLILYTKDGVSIPEVNAGGSVKLITAGSTAVDNVTVNQQTTKFIENGQLFIVKDGVRYNVIGQVTK